VLSIFAAGVFRPSTACLAWQNVLSFPDAKLIQYIRRFPQNQRRKWQSASENQTRRVVSWVTSIYAAGHCECFAAAASCAWMVDGNTDGDREQENGPEGRKPSRHPTVTIHLQDSGQIGEAARAGYRLPTHRPDQLEGARHWPLSFFLLLSDSLAFDGIEDSGKASP
jgi:hypothetical protein